MFKFNNRVNNVIFLFSVTVVSIFIFLQQIKLLNYLVWEDEFETIVTSKMMANGLILYKEIFNQHGPLTFLISVILENTNFNRFHNYRLIVALIQLLAILSIIKTKILKYNFTKIITIFIFSVYIFVVLPDLYSQTYTYQNLAGILLFLILIHYILPEAFYGIKQTKIKTIIFLALLTSIPFFAVTYVPIFLSFLLVSVSIEKIKTQLFGVMVGLILNITFVSLTSSWKGYFVLHYYLNATILSKFYPNQSLSEVPINIFRSIQPHFYFILPMMFLMGYIFIKFLNVRTYKVLILFMGFLSLLIRGVDFQALPFYYLIGISLIVALSYIENTKFKLPIITSILTISIIFYYFNFDINKIQKNQVPTKSDFQQLAEFTTTKEDKVFAYTFKNSEYILADRLPASNDFFYLPMQAEYYKNPIFGVENDICKQLEEESPKIGYLEKYDFSDKSKWDDYANCINNFISENYFQLPFNTLFIKKSMLAKESLISYENSDHSFYPSAKLEDTLNLNFNEDLKNNNSLVSKIGILFATYGKNINEDIYLEIVNNNNERSEYRISQDKIIDNRYAIIELNNERISKIKLKSNESLDLSVWQSEFNNKINSCVMIKFVNESFYFTPGCIPY